MAKRKVTTKEDRGSNEVEVPVEPIGSDPPDRFPPGTLVIVQVDKRKSRTGILDYLVDVKFCRVKFDPWNRLPQRSWFLGGHSPHPLALCQYGQLFLDDGSEPLPLTVKTVPKAPAAERKTPVRERKFIKNAELDEAAARGETPTKPIITSQTNNKLYQPRLDKLEAMAMADDWAGVRAYEVKGINTYAKMVAAYRDRLLAAHEARQSAVPKWSPPTGSWQQRTKRHRTRSKAR